MTHIFSNPNIGIASFEDIAVIKELPNNSYRGESSKQGWTTEVGLIAGEVRTNDSMLHTVIQQPGSVMLKYTNEDKEVIGCVNLQQHAHKIYLGMFSVSPHLQGAGIGKKLLSAAEEYAQHLQCMAIYMSVISVRTELIDWYKRHGYRDTGERKPFTEDGVTGRHLRSLEFMILEKAVSNKYS